MLDHNNIICYTTTMNKYTPISVTLSEQERRIISQLMEGMSMTFSGALRFVINDWARTQELPHDPVPVTRSTNLPEPARP